jgi:tRNA-dihydrouridine synthase B
MSASEDEQIALGGGADGASRPPPAGRDDVLAVLAPMAGYTDAAFRLLCRRRGCARTYTEVVNAEGIARGSRPTLYLLETLPDERPVVAHIYGRDPSVMAAAAVYIESLRRFDQVDVNTGCPVRKIVAKGCGAALMREPERVHEIVRAIVSAVSLPVTVKTRLGPTREELCVSEIAQAVEEGGAAEIAIHARTTAQKHGGEADWRTLARVKAERRIAVLGNGGVATAADALRMIRETGVDGVMIGRAAIGNPWIFENIRRLQRGEVCSAPSVAERKAAIFEHLNVLVELKRRDPRKRRKGDPSPGAAAALHFRPFLLKYCSGCETWKGLRKKLQSLRTLEDIAAVVEAG